VHRGRDDVCLRLPVVHSVPLAVMSRERVPGCAAPTSWLTQPMYGFAMTCAFGATLRRWIESASALYRALKIAHVLSGTSGKTICARSARRRSLRAACTYLRHAGWRGCAGRLGRLVGHGKDVGMGQAAPARDI
jgi:hypothetical protein